MRTQTEDRELLLLDPTGCEPSIDAKMNSTEQKDEKLINSQINEVHKTDDNDNDDDDDDDEFPEYLHPTDSETESSRFDNHDDNDDVYLECHLKKYQVRSLQCAEDKQYQRSKRSKKKLKAQHQIKTKHARSIQLNSHNEHLYIHHRLAKQITLTPAKKHYIRSPAPVPLYTPEALREIVLQYRQIYKRNFPNYTLRDSYLSKVDYELYQEELLLVERQHQQYRDYTINEFNIPDEPSYDDEMINFLLEMQNRDLSPEDYEMLLRLDDRVQRKTVNSNIFESLPVIDVEHHQLNDQCSICMENYQLGQQLKRLPCEHLFHSDCVERYLKEFSNQCPLDNLPLI